ncbi:hypothetical protein [Streptococcus pluranimalium]|uniref:hypothetical protein n=1 Tax=Streptococcus pluranimalium TaxID=82348 RepID=UPI003F68FF8B
MVKIIRINLKTHAENRKDLIDYCLNNHKQFLAIGWAGEFETFEAYFNTVRSGMKRINPVLNIFRNVAIDDLFWTRVWRVIIGFVAQKGKQKLFLVKS